MTVSLIGKLAYILWIKAKFQRSKMDAQDTTTQGGMQDETLTCKDCGKEFEFTVREQEFYAEKGFENKPQRCKECRIAKKNQGFERREYSITCSKCGKDATVPFKPTEGREVLCSDCFKASKEA